MPNNKLTDLRNHLFETLERLKDDEKPLAAEIDRAKAIADIARVIVDSAKVEVHFLEVTSNKGTGFLPEDEDLGPRRLAAAR